MELSRFLHENGAYDAFVNNYREKGDKETRMVDIANAFNWQLTPEGYEYWFELNKLWSLEKPKTFDMDWLLDDDKVVRNKIIRDDIAEYEKNRFEKLWDENIAKAKEAKIELQDNINPNHYTDMVISPYEYITKNGMNWEQGNAIKYISRYKNKNQAEDLKKAIKYIEMLIEREYNG